jgi:uncharacterized membrane protein
MAGIGFRLREIVTRKTFTEWLQLYIYSAVIFAGPWLLSILCLASLSVFALPSLQEEGVALFTISVVYCYAFSLITTGIVQLPVTRYVADRLYSHEASAIIPSFVGVIIFLVPVQALTASAFLAFCELPFAFKIAATGLYVTISVIWMAMIYLTAAKDYNALVLGFVAGYGVSFVLGWWLSGLYGTTGTMSGFLAGQTVLCFWLIWRIIEEFPNDTPFNLDFMSSFRMYPNLAVAGFFYSAAIWVDKMVFWFGPSGIRVESLFYTHFPYDSAMFFAYITIVPALALFLVRIETEFYEKYKAYFGGILAKDPLSKIEERRHDLVNALKKSLGVVVIYQGIITILVLVLLPSVLDAFDIDQAHLGLFRIAAVAAVFHVILLVLMVVLLYFDFRKSVMWLSILFFGLNLLFSWVTVDSPDLYGWGYLGATLLTLLLSIVVLWNRVEQLEFLTFVHQPISAQQRIMSR